MADVININDVLDRHVVLDLECVDRIYLNAYVPNLQVGGQVVTFLTTHLGIACVVQAPRRSVPGAGQGVLGSQQHPDPAAQAA